MTSSTQDHHDSFFSLSPQLVLDCVDASLRSQGFEASGRITPLNSIENRVYELEGLDGTRVVTKFYRPGRWSNEQIAEELEFTAMLNDAEMPVASSFSLDESNDFELLGGGKKAYLAQTKREGLRFSVYPRYAGRLRDELDEHSARKCGHFLAQIHNIGAQLGESTRREMSIGEFIDEPLDELEASPHISDEFFTVYEDVCLQIRELAEAKIENLDFHRIHGDCHCGNIIWSFDEEPLFVDFDDMMIGPAVQDLWMILRGRDEEDEKQKNEFIDAYSFFRDFDRTSLGAVEALRAMRMIHYSSWISKRWEDPSFPKYFPSFGSPPYWQEEIEALKDILMRLTNPTWS